jgi:hypothetical protein
MNAMRPSVSPGTGRLVGQAGSSHLGASVVLWMAGMGGLTGLLQAHGASLLRACAAVAVGAGLGMLIALRAETVTAWWTAAATAIVIALSALSHTDWAMARQEPLRQRFLFVVTILVVGARLWISRLEAARPFAHWNGNGSSL